MFINGHIRIPFSRIDKRNLAKYQSGYKYTQTMHEIDRFHRKDLCHLTVFYFMYYYSAIAKRKMRECGVKIEYVAETMPEDEAERALLEGIEEALAKQFIIQRSKNVSCSLSFNTQKAWYNGHKIFGYKGQSDSSIK